MAPAPPLAWPFVGRGLEVDQFTDALVDPSVDAFVVLGPPGVGKTRLTAACEHAAADLGVQTVRVTGRRGTEVPLAAMAHLLPAQLDLPDPGSATSVDAVALMHTIIRRFVEPDRTAGRARAGRPPRWLLLVDDADLLDPLSVTLVGQLVSAGAVFLLATGRGDGESLDVLSSLWGRDRAVRVELGPLNRQQVETLLHLALGGPVDAHTSVAYWSYSAGSPLGLRELVLDALERNVLVESGGVWRLTGPLLGGGRAEALAASRLRGLSERELELLELLAVAHELGLADVEARYPPDLLERLEERGLVAVRVDGRRLRLSVAHPLYEQAIRGGLSALRARRRRRAVIEMLERHGLRRREDRITVATLRLDNNEPADPVLLLRAAWLASHARDHAHAERLAGAAHAVAPTPTSARLWAEALHELGRFEESLRVLDTVDPAGTPEQRLALGLARANTLYWGLGRPDEALQVLGLLAADPELAGRQWEVEVQRATLAGYLGEIGLAAAALAGLGPGRGEPARPDVAGPDGAGPDGAGPDGAGPDGAGPAEPELAALGLVRHTVELLAGQVEAGLHTAEAAYAASVAAAGGGSPHPGIHLVNVVTALIELGRFEAAATLVGPLYEEAAVEHLHSVQRWGAVARGRLEVQRWAALAHGHLELDRGQLRAAERWFREAAEQGGRPVLPRAERLALGGVAIAAGMRLDAATAAAAIQRLDAIPGDPRAAWDIAYDRGRAWAVAAGGDVAGGCDLLLAAAERARRTGRFLLELHARHDWLRLGGTGAGLARLEELPALVSTPFARLAGRHARAVRLAEPAELERVAEQLAELGYLLHAAEAAEQAATLYRRQQQRRRAISCHNRSMVLRGRCEDPRTPLLASTVDAEPLSRREQEIALLVAAGETNKAIGERLFLSVRTVENHVQRVLGKLGCSRRSEIADALGLGPDRIPSG